MLSYKTLLTVNSTDAVMSRSNDPFSPREVTTSSISEAQNEAKFLVSPYISLSVNWSSNNNWLDPKPSLSSSCTLHVTSSATTSYWLKTYMMDPWPSHSQNLPDSTYGQSLLSSLFTNKILFSFLVPVNMCCMFCRYITNCNRYWVNTLPKRSYLIIVPHHIDSCNLYWVCT